MSKKNILLMYISKNSGHHHASLAIENALHDLSDDVETLAVDSFNYMNPVLEKIIGKTYMSVIRRKPEFWGYIYDNPKVVQGTQKIKNLIHRHNSNKTRALLERFNPDAVICTQAFPCGIMADYKKSQGIPLLLSGVLTDYAPHSYWMYDNVDMYFVPSEETKERLVANGIAPDKVRLTGIPIDPKFKKIIDKNKIRKSLNLSEKEPIILVMGGSQGLGPMKETIKVLNNSELNFQIIVVTGGNRKIYNYLSKRAPHFRKKVIVLGYVEHIDELMEVSSVIISKPGGITVSEALAKGLALFIVKPIPGHETMNSDHLTKNRVAIKVDNLNNIEIFLKELFSSPSALVNMQSRAKKFSKPNSALDIAKGVLERIM